MKQLLNSIKENKNRLVLTGVTALTVSTMTFVNAFADTTTPTLDLVTPFTTGINGMVTQTISLFSAAIPFGLLIFTAKYAWVQGVSFFATLAKKK